MVVKRKNGFTLVEILIVFAILAFLIIIAIGIINPSAISNKARDAQRKRDLGRIRVAFEEYNNDKGCYPSQELIDSINIPSNCGKHVNEFPQLKSWLCDPNGNTYKILVGENMGQSTGCSRWFKAYTYLQNLKDPDIPDGCFPYPQLYHFDSYNCSQVNYGISSTNVNWFDYMLPSFCDPYNCYDSSGFVDSCVGPNCSRSPDRFDECRVARCP